MDKNTIIGLLLIFALFMGFSFYTSQKNAKHREQVEKERMEQEQKAREDSIANAVAISMADQQNMNDTTAAVSTATSAPASETQKKHKRNCHSMQWLSRCRQTLKMAISR